MKEIIWFMSSLFVLLLISCNNDDGLTTCNIETTTPWISDDSYDWIPTDKEVVIYKELDKENELRFEKILETNELFSESIERRCENGLFDETVLKTNVIKLKYATQDSFKISYNLTRLPKETINDTIFHCDTQSVFIESEDKLFACSLWGFKVHCDERLADSDLPFFDNIIQGPYYMEQYKLGGRIFDDVVLYKKCHVNNPTLENYEGFCFAIAKRFGLVQFTDVEGREWIFDRFE